MFSFKYTNNFWINYLKIDKMKFGKLKLSFLNSYLFNNRSYQNIIMWFEIIIVYTNLYRH